MVIAYHLIWTVYGCWLPNDPRGSTSTKLRTEALADLGPIHRGRKAVQPPSRIVRDFYQQAEDVLKHPLVLVEESDHELLGQSFAQVIEELHYTCYACAVMPDHVHLLIRRHRHWAEEMIDHFQSQSRQALIDAGRRAATHPVWTAKGWKGFLNTPDDIRRVIQYIRQNPINAGKPEQTWKFVQPYDSR